MWKRRWKPGAHILAEMAEMERVPRGELVVAANEGTCLHILPEVFAEFKKLYPDVSVNVKRSESPKILEAIIENSIDFGVVSMPVTDKRLTTVVIHRDELVVIAPPRHPSVQAKDGDAGAGGEISAAGAEGRAHTRHALRRCSTNAD